MFKGKKISKVWWLVLLLALVVATALVALYLTQKTSAPDSTVDSETSMVPKTDATKFKEQYPKVVDNNKFVYSTDQEVMSIFDNGTGLVFLGFTECTWCQQLAPIVDEAARAEGLEKIYYLNIREARESNSPVYQALVDKLKDYLQKDEDGNVVTRITTDEQGREVSVPLWIDDAAYEREIKEIINKDVTIELHEVNVTGFKWPDTDVCREALDYMSDTFVTLHEGQIKPAQVPGKRNKVRPIKS